MLARLGVFRLLDVQRHVATRLPEDAGQQHRARASSPKGLLTYYREVVALPQLLDDLAQAEDGAAGPAFGGLPLMVISATDTGPGETAAARRALDALQRELAARSPAARHLAVEGADHLSLITDARHASEVADAVLALHASLAAGPTGAGGAAGTGRRRRGTPRSRP